MTRVPKPVIGTTFLIVLAALAIAQRAADQAAAAQSKTAVQAPRF